jgi:pimeloyl-ACP methyl ester carboxylesterase
MNLLLLHGALGTRDQLALLAADLPASTPCRIDLAGHGARPIPDGGLTFEYFVQDISTTLDEAGWQQVDLLGYSMGGYAALLFASRFPERVRSVVTLGTKLNWDREGLDRELRLLDPEKIQAKVPRFAELLGQQHGAERWTALVKETACLIAGLHEKPLLTPEVFATINCPVLLCVGDRDTTAVPEHTLHAARPMPKAGTLVLPNTPHPFEAVDRKVLLPHLQAFWAALPA